MRRQTLSSLLGRGFAAALAASFLAALPALSQEEGWKHGLSLMGEPKYPADFKHFDYVNPNAPKGGFVRFGQDGTFDNFNFVIPRGTAAAGITKLTYTLTPRITVVARAGMDNAIDVFYSLRFD